VENRLPMVRATIFGVTGSIDGNGRLLERTPLDKIGALNSVVALDGRSSFYTAWGDWLPTGCTLLIAGYLIATLALLARRVSGRLSKRTGS
jgi:apolipoprotein N-acyltransferase